MSVYPAGPVLRAHFERVARETGLPYVVTKLGVMPVFRRITGAQQGMAVLFNDHSPKVAFVLPVRDLLSYATALHELGHLGGEEQDLSRVAPLAVMCAEAGAWAWAEAHALCWPPAIQDYQAQCLQSYAQGLKLSVLQRALLADRGITHPYPPKDHHFWRRARVDHDTYTR